MNENCFIILSHSSYCDVWELTLKSYKNHFKSENIDLYITSDDNISPEVKNRVVNLGFKILYYPEDISWSESLRYVFNNYISINYSAVVFSFDDLVLLNEVHIVKFQECLSNMTGMDYLVLNSGHRNLFTDISLMFKAKRPYFKISKNDSYVGSLVFSMWNTAFFSKIINLSELDNLNPWQYEVEISKILDKHEKNGFYSVKKPLIEFANVIVKGKILQQELNKVHKYNQKEYITNRLCMDFSEEMRFNIYRKFFMIMRYLLPHSIFKKLRKTY
ncbi:hypothetical protein QO200_01020 [Flavobacterium sp. Arc3]|jgi:hypothetical protein|uniref:hypothetical protein n=1 Tax=Flavobacterium sp. Arc3 TaxID=3046686 RepID=UPI00352DDD5E